MGTLFLGASCDVLQRNALNYRSIKEIRALWRKGSRTLIAQRFICFGSMNLLVSMGVTVAFCASVDLLALSARQPPQMKGDTTTYFDSVVFLSMFLLAGLCFFVIQPSVSNYDQVATWKAIVEPALQMPSPRLLASVQLKRSWLSRCLLPTPFP
jgi:hypothetical protein